MPGKHKIFFTTRLSADREKKNLLFLDLIKIRKSTSRTEVSKLTDTNIVTVSNYINSYIKKGLVAETGYDISSGGRRPELVELNKKWGHVAGIEVADGEIKGVIMSLDMQVVAQDSEPFSGEKDLKVAIHELVEKMIGKSGINKETLKKIGIGASSEPGKVHEGILPAKDSLEREIGIPALCGQRALCASAGEKNLNAGAIETKVVLYVFKDTGESVVIRGNEYFEASSEMPKSSYLRAWPGEFAIGDASIKAAAEKDEAATDLIRAAGMNLGVRIAYLINIFEPESVIVGGGIEEAGGLFFDPLKKSIDKFVSREMKDKVKLYPACAGKDACVKGAAFLAIREALIEA